MIFLFQYPILLKFEFEISMEKKSYLYFPVTVRKTCKEFRNKSFFTHKQTMFMTHKSNIYYIY